MYKSKLAILVSAISLTTIMFIQSCGKENGETKISFHNGDLSHNMGQNCMNCHKSGGHGEGIFKAAGTVYDSLFVSTRSNGTVKLYTGPGGTGTVKATIDVDGKGNFYTTEAIDFSGGLYPAITGSNGDVHYMSSNTTTGQCNSCHGVNNDKIWVE